MLGKHANQRIKSQESTPQLERLIKAARAVVAAHHRRDRDEADDGHVADAIAELEESLRQRKRLPAKL